MSTVLRVKSAFKIVQIFDHNDNLKLFTYNFISLVSYVYGRGNMLKVFFIGSLLLLSLHAGTIKIAVAANVSYAIADIVKAFETGHPTINVRVTLGSSGKLTAQIKHGAPYDLFMSANMHYPQALYQEGMAVTKPYVYAQGRLAFLSTKKRDFTLGMKLLQSSDIKRIAIANPKTAPYGKAAQEALQKSGVYKSVKKKLVFAESVSQTLAYTIAATDIGLLAKSLLFSPKMNSFKEGEHWSTVSDELYAPIKQGIVLLKRAKSYEDAQAFLRFIKSREAQQILQQFGYSFS